MQLPSPKFGHQYYPPKIYIKTFNYSFTVFSSLLGLSCNPKTIKQRLKKDKPNLVTEDCSNGGSTERAKEKSWGDGSHSDMSTTHLSISTTTSYLPFPFIHSQFQTFRPTGKPISFSWNFKATVVNILKPLDTLNGGDLNPNSITGTRPDIKLWHVERNTAIGNLFTAKQHKPEKQSPLSDLCNNEVSSLSNPWLVFSILLPALWFSAITTLLDKNLGSNLGV